MPSDGQVIGAVQRAGKPSDIVVGASGGLRASAQAVAVRRAGRLSPGIRLFLHGLRDRGGIGVKMADPAREVVVMLGDGSYLMMNSEIATSVMMGRS
jgi:3D-(3,5/4)-trihydroxycyclohexane-1,2-dione acylhydrolase (decyclizing)